MKRERLEDIGRIQEKIRQVLDDPIFTHTNSKHCYETWVKENHDKIEYGEIRGLDGIFCSIRQLREMIEEIYYISCGDDDDAA